MTYLIWMRRVIKYNAKLGYPVSFEYGWLRIKVKPVLGGRTQKQTPCLTTKPKKGDPLPEEETLTEDREKRELHEIPKAKGNDSA